MASLLVERFVATDETHIAGHTFAGFLHVWFQDSGGLGSIVAQRAVSSLNLTAPEIATVQAIKSVYDALPNAADKVEYSGRIQAGLSLLESGDITPDEYETLLQI
jgi:hypothetical protein